MSALAPSVRRPVATTLALRTNEKEQKPTGMESPQGRLQASRHLLAGQPEVLKK